MVSDFIKGKKKYDYPPGILAGINLHRAIDTFTDTHESTHRAKEIFRPYYRLYSGPLMDVIYDHYLALDERIFTDKSLFDFAQETYNVIESHTQWLPEKFSMMFPYMKSQNWLYNYRTKTGISQSLQGLVRRSTYLIESKTAFHLFEENYQLLNDLYRQFWTDMRAYAFEQYQILKK